MFSLYDFSRMLSINQPIKLRESSVPSLYLHILMFSLYDFSRMLSINQPIKLRESSVPSLNLHFLMFSLCDFSKMLSINQPIKLTKSSVASLDFHFLMFSLCDFFLRAEIAKFTAKKEEKSQRIRSVLGPSITLQNPTTLPHIRAGGGAASGPANLGLPLRTGSAGTVCYQEKSGSKTVQVGASNGPAVPIMMMLLGACLD